jgi:hypothetical protein
MGTRADFYIGRGKDAEWLGSIPLDGYPTGVCHEKYPAGKVLLAATTVEDYRASLARFFKEKRDVTTPDMGWPWPWNDSGTTDYSYAFDAGEVWVSKFGYGWRRASEVSDETEWDESKSAAFPNMADRKNVTLGPRSGLIVFGALLNARLVDAHDRVMRNLGPAFSHVGSGGNYRFGDVCLRESDCVPLVIYSQADEPYLKFARPLDEVMDGRFVAGHD